MSGRAYGEDLRKILVTKQKLADKFKWPVSYGCIVKLGKKVKVYLFTA